MDILVNSVHPRRRCRPDVDPTVPAVGGAKKTDVAAEDHVFIRRIDRNQASNSTLPGLETRIRFLREGVAAIDARKNLVRDFHGDEIRAGRTFESEGDLRTVDGAAGWDAGGK